MTTACRDNETPAYIRSSQSILLASYRAISPPYLPQHISSDVGVVSEELKNENIVHLSNLDVD
jgi:hypothetical protein